MLPIYVGAVNGRMLRAAGAWADGVQLGAIVSPGYVRWSWAQIARGAPAGRPRPSRAGSGEQRTGQRRSRCARRPRRPCGGVLAYYIHRVEPIVLSTSGADPDEVERVRRTVLEDGARSRRTALISDGADRHLCRRRAIPTTWARLQEYLAAGLRGVLAWHVIGPDRERSLRLLADEVRPRVC